MVKPYVVVSLHRVAARNRKRENPMLRSEYSAHVALARAARYAPQVARNQASAVLAADRARRAKVRHDKRAHFAVVVLSVLTAVAMFYGAAASTMGG